MVVPVVAVAGIHLEGGRVSGWRQGAFATPEAYVEALHRRGLDTAILPLGRTATTDVLARFDGLVLLGGGDLDPHRYRAEPHPRVMGEDPPRDEAEIALIEAADRLRLPTFAICRGLQVMNVAFGGTLIQHIPDHGELADHGSGALELTCRSNHHQAVDALGEGLTPVAWSVDDGLVEALEREEGWMLGVQWHPERSAERDSAQQALFDGFAAEVVRRTDR